MDFTLASQILASKHQLADAIGMELVNTPEPDICVARMAVDERNRQPFGYLSGGATLAMAETLAGAGSCTLCPGRKCVGMNVSAQHIHAAAEGDTVTATARIIHQGDKTHVWQVEVRDSKNALISSISVTNFVI